MDAKEKNIQVIIHCGLNPYSCNITVKIHKTIACFPYVNNVADMVDKVFRKYKIKIVFKSTPKLDPLSSRCLFIA